VTGGHFIFIPAVLAVGILIGFLLGTRVAQDRLNLELKRQAEREEARRQRAERKAARAGQGAPGGEGAERPSTGTGTGTGVEAEPPSSEADTVKSKTIKAKPARR
jgi:hypothetical protein